MVWVVVVASVVVVALVVAATVVVALVMVAASVVGASVLEASMEAWVVEASVVACVAPVVVTEALPAAVLAGLNSGTAQRGVLLQPCRILDLVEQALVQGQAFLCKVNMPPPYAMHRS